MNSGIRSIGDAIQTTASTSQSLAPRRHPRIAQEAAEEHQQVGDQRRELPRLRSPSKEDQDNDGEQPNREGDADGCQKTAHSALNLTARTDEPRTLFQARGREASLETPFRRFVELSRSFRSR